MPFFGAETIPDRSGLIAHEWGTFTSVAGESGSPEYWTTLSGPSDLPCFVNRIPGYNLKAAMGLVRMETPVLYFYAPRKTTLSVRVDFPQGIITEWYPQAKVKPATLMTQVANGQIEWKGIEVLPGEQLEFPSSPGPSHYYAARATDSAPIRDGQQQEKLLFYRGMGHFSVPVLARFTREGQLEIRNAGAAPIPMAMVFENRGGKLGYRRIAGLSGTRKVDPPELTGDLEALRRDLADTLVELGLYRKEALAMIETWRDAWFEEGMRVIYTVPRAMVDEVLPLSIIPQPSSVARVFVGRVEVFSPSTEKALRAALAAGDVPALKKYARFLEPFMTQMGPAAMAPAARQFVDSRYRDAQREFYSPSCSQ